MTDIDTLFADMDKAEINGKGRRLSTGEYEVALDRCFVRTSEDPKTKGQKVFVLEMTIAQAFRASNVDDAPGAKRSWSANFTNQKTLGNLKELFLSVLGHAAANVPASHPDSKLAMELAKAICGSETAVAWLKTQGINSVEEAKALVIGQKVRVATDTISPNGFPYVLHRWSPTPEAAAAIGPQAAAG